VRPIVIDEAAQAGGQIYRQPPRGFLRSRKTLYGFEASRAQSVHSTFHVRCARPSTIAPTPWSGMPSRVCST
jgi:hypothetical protein